DDGDPVGQLIGFLQVLGGQQERCPLAPQLAHDCPDLTAAAADPGPWSARPGTGPAAASAGSKRCRAGAAYRPSRSAPVGQPPAPGRTAPAARRRGGGPAHGTAWTGGRKSPCAPARARSRRPP